jgi:hypothetical protein
MEETGTYEPFEFFGEMSFLNLAEHRLSLAMAEIDNLDVSSMSDDDIQTSAANLKAHFAPQVARLLPDGVSVGTPRPSQIPANSVPRAVRYSDDDEDTIRGYRTRVFVPFEGALETFGWRPEQRPHRYVFPGVVANGSVGVDLASTAPIGAENLRNDVTRVVADLQQFLALLTSESTRWPIYDRVLAELERRRELAANAKAVAEEVGVAWRNENEGKPTVWTATGAAPAPDRVE